MAGSAGARTDDLRGLCVGRSAACDALARPPALQQGATMARYGVITDIHGNFEALSAALAALDRAGVDRIVCCGDVVGYNADGDRCIQTLAERGIDTISGNHDLIAIGRLG